MNMSREIKFRAWNKYNKEMLYQGSNATHNNGVMDCRIVLDELGFYVLVRLYGKDQYEYRNNCELMQYTGLYDKNGKEIYEGDIVTLRCHSYKVEYHNGYYCLLDKDSVIRYGLGDFCLEDEVKVIGNIYENPELLDRKEIKKHE